MRRILAAAITASLFVLPGAMAEDAQPAAEPAGPSLSDIMVLQQMRHIKLWFAGRAGNWRLADYEIDALKDGFDDVTRMLGGDIVAQHVGAAIAAIEKSIDAKDRAAFIVAFDQLSAGCNACHHTLDHAFITIQRPALLPYSNQSFSPQR
jgi:hypothetical protein